MTNSMLAAYQPRTLPQTGWLAATSTTMRPAKGEKAVERKTPWGWGPQGKARAERSMCRMVPE
jgi:hypothetical protein